MVEWISSDSQSDKLKAFGTGDRKVGWEKDDEFENK
jgi:hypothetical protein